MGLAAQKAHLGVFPERGEQVVPDGLPAVRNCGHVDDGHAHRSAIVAGVLCERPIHLERLRVDRSSITSSAWAGTLRSTVLH